MSPPVAGTLSWWDEIQFMSSSLRPDDFLFISETALSVAPTDLTPATCGHSSPFLLLFTPLLCYYLPASHLAHKHLNIFVTSVHFFFLFFFWYDSSRCPIGQKAHCIYTWHSWSALHWAYGWKRASKGPGTRLVLMRTSAGGWWFKKGKLCAGVLTSGYKLLQVASLFCIHTL